MMPPADSFRRFAVRLVLVFVLLVLPWPGVGGTYRSLFRSLASALLCGATPERAVSFAPENEVSGPGRLRLLIVQPERMAPDGSGPVRRLDFNALDVGWRPTALVLALGAAVSLPWRRRCRVMALGVAAVHAYALGALGSAIWNEASHLAPGVVESVTIFDRLQDALLSQLSLAVPVLAWMLAMPSPARARRRPPARASVAVAALALALLFTGCERKAASATAPASPSPRPLAVEDEVVLPPRATGQMPAPVSLDAAFECPPEWQNRFGNFRSPLAFYDGETVEKAEDWPRRRAEIRRRWEEILGPWPEPIAHPACQVLETVEMPGFSKRRVRVELAPHLAEEGWLLVPAGPAAPHPAVLVLTPYAPAALATSRPFVEVAVELARRGYVTLTLGPPGGNPRQPPVSEPPCEPLSYLAYLAGNAANLLASLPEVDPAKIGVFGHGYGGKWAMFASCLDECFACAVWSEAGIVFDESKGSSNYNELWYLAQERPAAAGERERAFGRPEPMHREAERSRAGAYRDLHNLGLDLPELHALMAPRPFPRLRGHQPAAQRRRHLRR